MFKRVAKGGSGFTLFSNPRDIGKTKGVDWPFQDWAPRYNISPGTEIIRICYNSEAEPKEFDRF
ncbi:MAG: hypothetical protein VR73_10265 [Gammaproteobacteria bacterium BRH_c0]|nr:MAG: hypothetical protein VR73_10265 [Gammaproteobacteria bacterium BRH_c0]